MKGEVATLFIRKIIGKAHVGAMTNIHSIEYYNMMLNELLRKLKNHWNMDITEPLFTHMVEKFKASKMVGGMTIDALLNDVIKFIRYYGFIVYNETIQNPCFKDVAEVSNTGLNISIKLLFFRNVVKFIYQLLLKRILKYSRVYLQ